MPIRRHSSRTSQLDKKLLAKMAAYLADKRAALKATKTFAPDQEASHARVLAEAIQNQKL